MPPAPRADHTQAAGQRALYQYNRAVLMLFGERDRREVIAAFDDAIESQPDYADAQHGQARAHLLRPRQPLSTVGPPLALGRYCRLRCSDR